MPGTVSIDDVLYGTEYLGGDPADEVKFRDFETFKKATIIIGENLPVVGETVEKGATVWGWIEAIYKDATSMVDETRDLEMKKH
jgi:hypothetical protein